jgi:hypothetical protein
LDSKGVLATIVNDTSVAIVGAGSGILIVGGGAVGVSEASKFFFAPQKDTPEKK